ncbi:unnamed protein product [Vitrella brassicaformis CCMP3155]|uniref:Uncharacterized protein n=3 Tax=Vitrella brassicaformis TaxID=1169539 RepID=A0A0G4EXK8_VITBC|nr:unnamed protein product [Vitrella brassicaformis CCMP3155]|eukprot:CEM03339.1 unnamed protein product [Vitrella brassicaformis CCMP3155]
MELQPPTAQYASPSSPSPPPTKLLKRTLREFFTDGGTLDLKSPRNWVIRCAPVPHQASLHRSVAPKCAIPIWQRTYNAKRALLRDRRHVEKWLEGLREMSLPMEGGEGEGRREVVKTEGETMREEAGLSDAAIRKHRCRLLFGGDEEYYQFIPEGAELEPLVGHFGEEGSEEPQTLQTEPDTDSKTLQEKVVFFREDQKTVLREMLLHYPQYVGPSPQAPMQRCSWFRFLIDSSLLRNYGGVIDFGQAINAFECNRDPHVSHLTLTSRGGLPFRNFLGALFDILTAEDGCPLPLPLPPTVEGTVRKKPPPAHYISGFIAEYLPRLKDLLPPLLVPSSGSEAPSSGKHTHSTRTPVHSTPQVTKLTDKPASVLPPTPRKELLFDAGPLELDIPRVAHSNPYWLHHLVEQQLIEPEVIRLIAQFEVPLRRIFSLYSRTHVPPKDPKDLSHQPRIRAREPSPLPLLVNPPQSLSPITPDPTPAQSPEPPEDATSSRAPSSSPKVTRRKSRPSIRTPREAYKPSASPRRGSISQMGAGATARRPSTSPYGPKANGTGAKKGQRKEILLVQGKDEGSSAKGKQKAAAAGEREGGETGGGEGEKGRERERRHKSVRKEPFLLYSDLWKFLVDFNFFPDKIGRYHAQYLWRRIKCGKEEDPTSSSTHTGTTASSSLSLSTRPLTHPPSGAGAPRSSSRMPSVLAATAPPPGPPHTAGSISSSGPRKKSWAEPPPNVCLGKMYFEGFVEYIFRCGFGHLTVEGNLWQRTASSHNKALWTLTLLRRAWRVNGFAARDAQIDPEGQGDSMWLQGGGGLSLRRFHADRILLRELVGGLTFQ